MFPSPKHKYQLTSTAHSAQHGPALCPGLWTPLLNALRCQLPSTAYSVLPSALAYGLHSGAQHDPALCPGLWSPLLNASSLPHPTVPTRPCPLPWPMVSPFKCQHPSTAHSAQYSPTLYPVLYSGLRSLPSAIPFLLDRPLSVPQTTQAQA